WEESLVSLFERCHEGLKPTRGVAMSIASYNSIEGTITWSGIGNVKGILMTDAGGLLKKKETLLLRSGIVGSRFSAPRLSVVSVTTGATLILVTDGISLKFSENVSWSGSPKALADLILAGYSKGSVDALVVVGRIVEESR